MRFFDHSKIRALILDMDGVIWRGGELLGDLPAIFKRLRDRGLGVMLATNNSTRTPAQYIERLSGCGVQLEPWQVINSSEATAQYLRGQFPAGGAICVVGESGLVEALAAQGFQHNSDNALAVVVGLDRQFSYEKVKRANHLIRNGALFLGTNPDRTFPTPQGQVPGAGVMLAAIEAACYAAPTIVGKPETFMYRAALERLGTTPAETLVVGDRLETDIAGAQKMGCPAALVLSGVTSRTQAEAWLPAPDLVIEDLTALVNLLDNSKS